MIDTSLLIPRACIDPHKVACTVKDTDIRVTMSRRLTHTGGVLYTIALMNGHAIYEEGGGNGPGDLRDAFNDLRDAALLGERADAEVENRPLIASLRDAGLFGPVI